MKKFLLLFVLLPVFVGAQNLVPNPSFEDTVSCPDGGGQVWRAQGWYIAENSPDYFNSCCINQLAGIGVPNNDWGYRNAAFGSAYSGFGTYVSWQFLREKIGVQLSSPLQIGTRYYVSFEIGSCNNHYPVLWNGGTNKTGALFSTVKYDLTNLSPTNNFCQVWTDSIITDTLGWFLVKGSFIADSAYEYLTLGNFFDDAHTDTLNYFQVQGNPGMRAYNFIDNVCVTTDSIGCVFGDNIYDVSIKNDFLIYPNPVDGLLTAKLNSVYANSILLYNSLGQIIYLNNNAIRKKNIEINTEKLSEGIYFLQLKTDNEILTKKILIIHS